MCTGDSPRNFPSHPHENDTCAMTPCTAIQDQTSVVFFWRAPRNPLVGNGMLFLSCKGDPPKNDNAKVTLGLARFKKVRVFKEIHEIGRATASLTCSFCHLDFVKEFLRFGRNISAKIGESRLNIGQNSTQIRLKIDYPLTRNYYENISPRIIFRNFWGIHALKISAKDRLFAEITHEIRNFSKIIISESLFVRNTFVSEGNSQLKSTKWGLFISHLRWWERTPKIASAVQVHLSCGDHIPIAHCRGRRHCPIYTRLPFPTCASNRSRWKVPKILWKRLKG